MIKVDAMIREMRKTVGLNQPKPFHVIYSTASRKRNTGGEFRELKRAILLTKQIGPDRILSLQPQGTRDIISVYLDLIIYFNGQPLA